MLQRAQDRGELRPDTNSQLTVETLLGALYVRLLLLPRVKEGTG